jgi:hypothetical protein
MIEISPREICEALTDGAVQVVVRLAVRIESCFIFGELYPSNEGAAFKRGKGPVNRI